MATTLAASTARRAAILARLSPSATRAPSLIRRRGLSGAAECDAPPKVDSIDPDLKFENYSAYAGMSMALGFFGCLLTGGSEKHKEETVAEPTY